MQFDGFLRTDTRNRVSGPVGVASKRVEAPSTQEKPTSSMSANHPPSALIGAPPDPKSSPTCPIDTCPPPSDHGVTSEPIAAVVPTGDRASEAPKINENTNNDKKRSQPPRAAAVRYMRPDAPKGVEARLSEPLAPLGRWESFPRYNRALPPHPDHPTSIGRYRL